MIEVAIAMWDDRSTIDGVCCELISTAFRHASLGMPTLDICFSPSCGSTEFAPFHAASASHFDWPDVGGFVTSAISCSYFLLQVRPSNFISNDWSKADL